MKSEMTREQRIAKAKIEQARYSAYLRERRQRERAKKSAREDAERAKAAAGNAEAEDTE